MVKDSKKFQDYKIRFFFLIDFNKPQAVWSEKISQVTCLAHYSTDVPQGSLVQAEDSRQCVMPFFSSQSGNSRRAPGVFLHCVKTGLSSNPTKAKIYIISEIRLQLTLVPLEPDFTFLSIALRGAVLTASLASLGNVHSNRNRRLTFV